MAPAPSFADLNMRSNDFKPGLPSQEFRTQWIQPSDVFSILLILGGDVINRALAQLAGGRFTPVTFSFGWVAYAVSALVSAVGENKLMPPADCKSIVINGKNGYYRDNSSWVIGRVVRDYEHWMHLQTRMATAKIIEERWKVDKDNAKENGKDPNLVKKQTQTGLVVSFYRPKKVMKDGKPALMHIATDNSTDSMCEDAKRARFRPLVTHDWIYWSGAIVAIFQLGVAAIPVGLWGDWGILLVTAIGIVLAFATGSLTQWRNEKWACRQYTKKNVILTRGNGSQHAIVILGNGNGVDLEDLAAGSTNVDTTASVTTRVGIMSLATLWIMLLITAAGIHSNTWFLLAVGGVGILQNVMVAGWPRRPENFGIQLEFENVIACPKAMKTLFECEDMYPCVGESMLSTFFPGDLRPDEKVHWEHIRMENKRKFTEWQAEWLKKQEGEIADGPAANGVRVDGTMHIHKDQ